MRWLWVKPDDVMYADVYGKFGTMMNVGRDLSEGVNVLDLVDTLEEQDCSSGCLDVIEGGGYERRKEISPAIRGEFDGETLWMPNAIKVLLVMIVEWIIH